MSLLSIDARKKSQEKSLKLSITNEITTDKINYEEEVTLLFYNSILEDLVNDVEELSEHKRPCEKNYTSSTDTATRTQYNVSEVTKVESVSSFNRPNYDNPEVVQQVIAYEGSSQDISQKESVPAFSANSIVSFRNIKTIINQSMINTNTNMEDTWSVYHDIAKMRIDFQNGNSYDGGTYSMLMHGKGTFRWADGTYYEGDFKKGQIIGTGKMVYTDLTYYEGEFCNGYFHGCGMFNIVRSTIIYKGEWRQGKKHGKGWMYYGKLNWYEGGWYKDERHGLGLRQYPDGSIYNGYWSHGKQNGKGVMYWKNKDFYKGSWKNGVIDGKGTYTWRINVGTDMVCMNNPSYRGSWSNGLRHGAGEMYFALRNNAKLIGTWKNNMKHGQGTFSCNGNIVTRNPLFLNDKPVHLQTIDMGFNPDDYQRIPGVKHTSIICNPIELRSQIGLIDANFSYLYDTALKTYYMQIAEKSIVEFENTYETDTGRKSSAESLIRHIAKDINKSGNALKSFSTDDCRHCRLYASLRENEEKMLRNCMRKNGTDLIQIYYWYCSIYNRQKCDYIKNVPHRGLKIIRLMMWIFFMDIGIPQRYISLIDIDILLANNPHACLNTIHNPFESLSAYAFIVCIIAVAWKLYTEIIVIENLHRQNGMVAFVFKKFKEDFLNNLELFNSFDIKHHSDLIPLKQVYLLYKEIGEPHTAKDFLRRCCVSKIGYKCYIDKLKRIHEPTQIHQGKNSIALNICCILTSPRIGCKFNEIKYTTKEDDPYFNDLLLFSKLGCETILKQITKVCPLVLTDNQITRIDYPLSFIEFYQILILCAEVYVERQQKEESIGNLVVPIKSVSIVPSRDQKKTLQYII